MIPLSSHTRIQALFDHRVKHSLIPCSPVNADNQAMLTGPELGKRMKTALKDAKLSQSYIAEEMGITPQAVSAWFKTGRIAKNRLSRFANLVHRDLDYFLSDQKTALTKMTVSNTDAEAVRTFLTANGAWRELWLEVVKKNDVRLRRIVEAYYKLEESGRQMILSAARGAELLRGANEREDLGDTGKGPKRKGD